MKMLLRIFHVPGRSGPSPSPEIADMERIAWMHAAYTHLYLSTSSYNKPDEFSIPICIGIVGHLATSRTYGQVDSAYLCIKIIEDENGSHVRMHVV